ncbi:vesicular acetylcholine transporter-like [Amphiura filiformis]|uniref:vesicular acetylcholine transporter-like n=1 Tax=Amphiura filiformis TaxID=82378 RepID=UPI003B21A07E
MQMPISWRTYVMVACGLMAVLLDVLPPQMLVPITPEWLGWCDDKPLTPTVINVTEYEVNITSVASTDTTTTMSSSESTWTDEETNSSEVTQYDASTLIEVTSVVLIDNSSCTKKDFDPRISLVYLAAGPIEVLSSPFVALLCDRIGSNALLLFGLISTAFIDIPFAYGSGFLTYLLVRIFINISTTITEVSYLHMIGQLFAGNDVMRARFLGLYSTVLGFDYFGPTFSGVLYHLYGQAMPFLTLLVIGLITALVFFIFGQNCKITKNNNVDETIEEIKTDIPYLTLVKDPYIIVVFIAIFLIILPKAMIAPLRSILLMDKFDTSAWVTGIVYFPGFVAFVISVVIAERLLTKCKEYAWAIGAVSLAIDGISVITLPFSPNIVCFSVIFALQVAAATISGFTIFPMFLKIADKRYGCPKSSSVHGFSFMAVALAYFIGPMLASELFMQIGFRFINLGVGGFHIFVAPFIAMLRKLNDEKKEITEETYLVTSSISRESLHDPGHYNLP